MNYSTDINYGIGGKLMRAVKSFNEGSRACVRVGRSESDWSEVNVGLRQDCVMSPWLFNVYIGWGSEGSECKSAG